MNERNNNELDKMLENLDREETLAERKGRYYVEGEARFATATALQELAKTVVVLARTQTEQTIAISDLVKSAAAAAKDAETMKMWMEGTVDNNGTRQPGIIDHIGTFKRWKNWVLTLLSLIAVGQITNTVIGLLNHTAVTTPIK